MYLYYTNILVSHSFCIQKNYIDISPKILKYLNIANKYAMPKYDKYVMPKLLEFFNASLNYNFHQHFVKIII